MITEIFKEVLILSISGSIVALAILLMRKLFWRSMSARMQYVIWILLFIRLSLPFLPSSPISIFSIYLPTQTTAQNIAQQDTGSVTAGVREVNQPDAYTNIVAGSETPQITNSAQSVNHTFSFTPGLNYETAALVWLIGAAAILLYFLGINTAVRIRLSKQKICRNGTVTALLDDYRSGLKLRRPINIVYDSIGNLPAVFGIFCPCIIISENFIEQSSPDTLKYILMHELTHVKRRDNILNLIIMLFEIVNWFNPLLWYAFCKIKEDCEILCDASVISTLDEGEKRNYGYAIVNTIQTMHSRFIPGTAGFTGNFTKRRIIMISNRKKISVAFTAVALAVTMLAGCASFPANVTTPITNSSNANSTNQSMTNSISSITATKPLQKALDIPDQQLADKLGNLDMCLGDSLIFTNSKDISSDTLYSFFCYITQSEDYGKNYSDKWYNKKEGKYHIPIKDIIDILNRYFDSVNFDPSKLPATYGYNAKMQELINNGLLGFGGVRFPKLVNKEIISDNTLKVSVDYYTDDTYKKVDYNKAYTILYSDVGYKYLSIVKG